MTKTKYMKSSIEDSIEPEFSIETDTETIEEEITYEIQPEIIESKNKKENQIEVKFLKFSKNKLTSVFLDNFGNGIEIPTQDRFISLNSGDIIKINI